MGSAVQIFRTLPTWAQYAIDFGVAGAVAVVTPTVPGSSIATRVRSSGTPVYILDITDIDHWCWAPVPESDVGADNKITGSIHQVATRRGLVPSDPTIEQFDPTKGPIFLYITDGN